MERREAEQGVLSFLKSKGYLSACNALKADARISTAIECAPRLEHIFSVALTATVPNNYFENYQHLQAWADRTLPKYRQDLQRLLFPAFAYLYLEMVRHSLPEARDFFLRFSGEHTYKEDLALLETLSSARKLDSDTGRLFLENMMRVKISKCALQLLMSFIESEGFSLMYWVMSKYVDFEVTAEASGSKAVLLDKDGRDIRNSEHISLQPFAEDGKVRREAKTWTPRLFTAAEARREDDEQSRQMLSEEQPPPVCFHTLYGASGLLCADVAEEGSLLVGGFEDSSVRLWDLRLSSCLCFRGHSGSVFSVKFSPCGRLFITGGEDGCVRLWSLLSVSAVAVLKGHVFSVWALAFSPQGFYFASGGADCSARVWTTDGVQAVRVFLGHLSDVTAVRLHPASPYLASASSDKTVRLWDLETGQCVRLLAGHCMPVRVLEFAWGGRWLVSGDEGGLLCAWDVQESGVQWTRQLEGALVSASASHEDTLLSIGSEANRLWVLSPKGAVLFDCPTKHTPVLALTFTWRNLLVAIGPMTATT